MANINGYGMPTDRTVGMVDDIYTDLNTGIEYKCVAIHEITSDTIVSYYTWVRKDPVSGGVGSVDAVKYTEQYLSEDQQMQARRNLGLYATVVVPSELAATHATYLENGASSSELGGILPDTLPDEIQVTIKPVGSDENCLDVKLNRRGRSHKWSEFWCSYYGNYNFIKDIIYAVEAPPSYHDILDDNVYPDVPFCLYRHDTGAGDSGWLFTYDRSKFPWDPIGYDVRIIDPNNKSVAYDRIPKEFMPSEVSNSVQCTEQYLSEDQQMQARANMGLYTKRYEREIAEVYSYVYVGWWEGSGDLSLVEGSSCIVSLKGVDYPCSGHRHEQSMTGVGYAYVGNTELLPEELRTEFGIEIDTQCVGYPFVIYHEIGKGDDSIKVIFDETLSFGMGEGLYVYEDRGMVAVYETIPEEYLPQLIVKDQYGNRYTLIVNDNMEVIPISV